MSGRAIKAAGINASAGGHWASRGGLAIQKASSLTSGCLNNSQGWQVPEQSIMFRDTEKEQQHSSKCLRIKMQGRKISPQIKKHKKHQIKKHQALQYQAGGFYNSNCVEEWCPEPESNWHAR